MKLTLQLMAILVAIVLVGGCGEAKVEKSTDVGPNVMGIQYSLEGDTVANQSSMNPETLAKANKVQGRTIIHSQRKRYTGYFWQWWEYEWVNTDSVLTVAMTPVTKEWRSSTNNDHVIDVESKNSIGFSLGASIQARHIPDQIPHYVSVFGGKQLTEVVDDLAWGYAQKRASHYFGQHDLDKAPELLNEIALKIKEDLKKFFEQYGVEIVTFSWVGGTGYDNEEIQKRLNEVFVAENDELIATQELNQARQQIAIDIQAVNAEKRQALLLWNSRQGVVSKTSLDLLEVGIEADKALIGKWSGRSSQIVPEGKGTLWFLGENGIAAQIEAIRELAKIEDPELDKLAAQETARAKAEAEERAKLPKPDPHPQPERK